MKGKVLNYSTSKINKDSSVYFWYTTQFKSTSKELWWDGMKIVNRNIVVGECGCHPYRVC